MNKETSTDHYMPMTSIARGKVIPISNDLYSLTIQIVNICLYGDPSKTNEWVLIDAGMPKSINKIKAVAEEIFGKNNKLKAIILTHGHFDHVGALEELLGIWNVPVYAHPLELPFLTGKTDYPKPDGTVEGGIIAKISPLFPHEAINISEHIYVLPSDGTVPEMPGWKWIHTPGHTPGHISLFREKDGVLIAGDAFVTVRQDSLYNVLIQKEEINGPPRYFTTNWQDAWNSVKTLKDLNPLWALTGHGLPMSLKELEVGLTYLAQEFDKLAIPDYGRYV